MSLATCHVAAGDEHQPEIPFARLFDVGSASPRPLPPETISAKTGWTLLVEDDLTHRFGGDVALRNNRLTIVLRRNGPGAEVYSHASQGPRLRAVLMVLPTTGRAVKRVSAVRILENNPGAVMVNAEFETATGSHSSMKLRLTTGQPIVEIRPGDGADRMVVRNRPHRLIVPDFFGDDMVFGPEAFDCARHGLPTENLLLHLLGDANAVVMCVWKSGEQRADALLVQEDGRWQFDGCEIQCAKDQPIWIAAMEGSGLWHERKILRTTTVQDVVLDWMPPFSARWRADLVREGGVTESCDFGDAGRPSGWCRLDGDRAVVDVPSPSSPPTTQTGKPAPVQVVVYPIDRSRTTPLAALTPTDVLRNTLGVGPCQYILQTEGLASDASPTPDQAMDWIEKQFKRKKEEEATAQIGDLLVQMVEHVARAQARIEQYAEFARAIRALCDTETLDEPDQQTSESLGLIAKDLEQIADGSQRDEAPAKRAEHLADEVIALIGQENAFEKFGPPSSAIRQIGAVQDRSLSKYRMTVRWLKEKARMQILTNGDNAELAKNVWTRARRFLQTE